MTEPLPLIRTKLYRPRTTRGLVARARLLERLEQRRDRPLTLIVAPAGYGKSTLVANWLETCGCPSAWLSLDEDENDLALFLSYLVAAVQTIFPGACHDTQAMLKAATLPPTSLIAGTLTNELDQIEQPFILVLDDYHAVQNMNVHHVLTELLRHPPRPLHLVLTTRSDPPLPMTQLRARGQATEIRTQALRFTEAETAAFLQSMGMQVDEQRVRALVERVEGWVTGVRLAVLSARHRGSEDLAQALVESSVSYITNYFVAEVLEGQPPGIQDYLLATSILERFCALLCEAVQFGKAELPSSSGGTAVSLGSTQVASSREAQADEGGLSGQAYLDWLEASDLFVVPLDDRHEWYRYHHLFQQLLRNQLRRHCGPDEIAALHARASAWYAENDLIDEALSHALSAGDHFRAANLLEQNVHRLLNKDQWHTVRKWLALLPAEIVQQRPQLLLAKAWMAYYQLDVMAIPGILESSEALLDDSESSQPLRGQIDFFQGSTLLWQGQASRCLELLNSALVRIPEAYHMARGEAEIFWSLASQMVGQHNRAVRFLYKRLHDEQTTHPSNQSRLLAALSYVHFLSGELTVAAATAQRVEEMGVKYKNAHVQAWGSYLQALIHYCWNDLENAAHHFASAVERRYSNSVLAAIDSLAGSALCYRALGLPDKPKAMMAQLLEFAQETSVPDFVTIALSCQARLSLLQGDLASAVRWLPTADLTTDTSTMFFWLEVPRLTACRVLIALGSEASLQEAVDKLQRYAQEVKAQNNTFQLVHILLLQALAYQKKEQRDRALAALERAVTLAEGGAFIRPFVELGPTMAGLLEELRQQGVMPVYVSQILAAFPARDDADASIWPRTELEPASSVARPLSATAGDATGGLVEPLTNRELEVLELMAERLTNKEIAAQLVLSVGTVKQHAYNIYQKLHVKGRRQAVAKATSLGILSRS